MEALTADTKFAVEALQILHHIGINGNRELECYDVLFK